MTRRSLIKQPVETYENYTIYIVVGMNPVHYIAEKPDPTKGITLTADNLEQLKKDIDDTLTRTKRMKINVWEGPVRNKTFPNVRIKSNNATFNGLAIVIECNYELEDLITIVGTRIRIPKKHRKKPKHINLIKFYGRDYTLLKNRTKDFAHEQYS